MADETEPLDDAPDPTEDTPDDEAEDTPEGDDSGQTDWEARYKEAQKVISRQGNELSLLRRGESTDDEDSEEEAEDEDDAADEAGDGAPDPYLRRLESQSWELVRSTYGQESIDAYDAAYRIFAKAQTPADYIAAFEAYAEIKSGKRQANAAAPAKGGKSRQEVVQPRVDTNRSDGPASSDPIAEAVKGGSLSDFTGAVAAKFGYGPSRPK